jgi:hypothetical protein
MRITVLVCCILVLALSVLVGLSYAAEIPSEVSVTGIDDGVVIQNVGNIPCLVVVDSLEGEQQFELAVGANARVVTLSDITHTTHVLAFGSTTVRVDLEELDKFENARDKLTKLKYDLCSNLTVS